VTLREAAQNLVGGVRGACDTHGTICTAGGRPPWREGLREAVPPTRHRQLYCCDPTQPSAIAATPHYAATCFRVTSRHLPCSSCPLYWLGLRERVASQLEGWRCCHNLYRSPRPTDTSVALVTPGARPCALTQVGGHHDLDALVRAHGGQRREVVDLGEEHAVTDPASVQEDVWTGERRAHVLFHAASSWLRAAVWLPAPGREVMP